MIQALLLHWISFDHKISSFCIGHHVTIYNKSNNMQIKNSTLYYFYDPMCSWCYAFEKSLLELQKQLHQLLSFKPILGGLAPDATEPMSVETQSMVQHAWQQIEKNVPDMRFNFDFWTQNIPLRSTYPACRALLAAEQQSPLQVESLRKNIQQAYYQEAKNPSLDAILIDCAAQSALNIEQFSRDLNSTGIQRQLIEHIEFSRSLSVNSYPSLRLVLNDEIYTIDISYTEVNSMLNQINTLMDVHKSR